MRATIGRRQVSTINLWRNKAGMTEYWPTSLPTRARVTSPPWPCPCCGFLTLAEPPPGTYAICPVCYWEDDPLQFYDLDYEGGPNAVSLSDARRNFAAWGASEERYIQNVRPPRPAERP